MPNQKLPIGIDSFEELRSENFFYIDKSNFISDLLYNRCKVMLFTRPRRFGKTLNMSMLKSFFEIGTNPSLFHGLSISEDTDLCSSYLGQYPVIFISLKGIDSLNFPDARDMLIRMIKQEAERFQQLLSSTILTDYDKSNLQELLSVNMSDSCLKNSLKTLTDLLYRHYSQKVILLIDEYDVPLDKAYQHGYYEEMLSLIRSMFHAALKTNDSLYLAVMTGCLKVSKESIFTGLNNLKTYTITDSRFDRYFGFTEAEVQLLLNEYNLESFHDIIKEWYDGYHFGNQDIYCPWDVLNCCHDLLHDADTEPEAYWRNTSGNQTVRTLIDHADTGTVQMEIETLIAGNSIHKTLNEQLTYDELDKNLENIWSLLFMTGYLTTAKRPQRNVYELIIPNKEIREIYTEQVLSWFQDQLKTTTQKQLDLYQAFSSGNAALIESILNEYLLDTISFHDAYESFYHGFLLALLSSCENWFVTSNAETGRGRSDILVEQKDRNLGFIIEVKYTKEEALMETSAKNAIRQVEEKDYTAYLRKYRFKNVWIFGIAFCEKRCLVAAQRMDG